MKTKLFFISLMAFLLVPLCMSAQENKLHTLRIVNKSASLSVKVTFRITTVEINNGVPKTVSFNSEIIIAPNSSSPDYGARIDHYERADFTFMYISTPVAAMSFRYEPTNEPYKYQVQRFNGYSLMAEGIKNGDSAYTVSIGHTTAN